MNAVLRPSFRLSGDIQSRLGFPNATPGRECRLSAQKMAPLDRYFFDLVEGQFKKVAGNAYTFRPGSVGPEHNVQLEQDVSKMREPIVVKHRRGSDLYLYGNKRLETEHLRSIQHKANALHQAVRRTLDLPPETSQLSFLEIDEQVLRRHLPAEQMRQLTMTAIEFGDEKKNRLGLSEEDITLLHYVLGEFTFFGDKYVHDFPRKGSLGKDLAFVRFPSLSFLISAAQFVALKQNDERGYETDVLQPYFTDFTKEDITHERIRELHAQGYHPIDVPEIYEAKPDEKIGKDLVEILNNLEKQKSFKRMFRSILNYIQALLMINFARDIYGEAYVKVLNLSVYEQGLDSLEGFEDLPEIKNLLKKLTSHECTTVGMPHRRMKLPSHHIKETIVQMAETCDKLCVKPFADRMGLFTPTQIDDHRAFYMRVAFALKKLARDFEAIESQKRHEFSLLRIPNLAMAI